VNFARYRLFREPGICSEMNPNHAPLLDLLRAAAALLVLFGHTRSLIFTSISSVDRPGPALKFFWLITVLEQEAVVIFFVLSGFLVGGAIVKSMSKGSFQLTRYLIARFSRIYVVYVPALILTGTVFWIGNTLLRDFGGETIRPLFSEYQPGLGGLRSTLCHFASVQGFLCDAWKENTALWSLGYEWTLYLLAPAILALLTLARGPIVVRSAAALLVFCGAVSVSTDLTNSVSFWFGAWFFGVAAWQVSQKHQVPLAAGLLGLTFIVGGMAVSRLQIIDVMITNVVIATGTALAITCRPLRSFPLGARFFGWAAGFSYSLYATHLPVVFLTIAIFQNFGLPAHKAPPSALAFSEFGLCVAASIAVSYLFSIFTEQRTDKVRHWLNVALFASPRDKRNR